ncbi:hypothetical protein Tco_1283581 [Tanacetum coccineum]
MLEGNGPKWLFDLDSLTQSMNYVPVVAGTFSNVSAAQDGTHDDCSFQDNGIDDQQVNTACPQVNTGSREVNNAAPEINTATPEGLMGPIPTTEDTQTSVQTRRMTTLFRTSDLMVPFYEGKTHQDIRISCLCLIFLISRRNQREFLKALMIPAWVQQKKKGIFISQDKYVHEILKKFNYTDVKSASTPTDLEKPLVKDADADDVDEHLYRSMIGSLIVSNSSRPDIIFAVCAFSRFSDSPLELFAYSNDSDYAGLHLIGRRFLYVEHLKLDDQDGITSLPTTEIFAQLALMGYATDSDNPKKTAWEQFSSNIAAAVICLATNRKEKGCEQSKSLLKKKGSPKKIVEEKGCYNQEEKEEFVKEHWKKEKDKRFPDRKFGIHIYKFPMWIGSLYFDETFIKSSYSRRWKLKDDKSLLKCLEIFDRHDVEE